MHAKIVFNVIIINRESIIINGNIDHQLNDIFIMLIKIYPYNPAQTSRTLHIAEYNY